jgi:hypothetical protein
MIKKYSPSKYSIAIPLIQSPPFYFDGTAVTDAEEVERRRGCDTLTDGDTVADDDAAFTGATVTDGFAACCKTAYSVCFTLLTT